MEKTSHLYVNLCEKGSDNKLLNPWTLEEVARVFKLIGQRCQNSLTRLHLELNFHGKPGLRAGLEGWLRGLRLDGRYPQPVQLQVLLGSLWNLRELTLSGECNIGDQTLLVVGLTCKQLSHLNISGNKNVSDQGVNNLYAASAPYGRCRNLEELDLESTSVTVNGVLMALLKLPHLVSLTHEAILAALEKFVEVNGVSKQLKLKDLSFEDDLFSPRHVGLERVCRILPDATSVDIDKMANLCALFNLNNVSKFCCYDLETSLQEFNAFVKHFGSTLTSITIDDYNIEIDVTVFGCYCPNLKELNLQSGVSSEHQFEILPNSFMKLEMLDLYHSEYGMEAKLDVSVLPDSTVKQLLSSKTLHHIFLNCLEVPERLLCSLIKEAN